MRLRKEGIKIRVSNVLEKYLTLLEYLWVFAVILNGNSVFHALMVTDLHLLEISVALTGVLLISTFIIRNVHVTRCNAIITIFVLMHCTAYLSVMQTQINAGIFIKLLVIGGPLAFLLFAELNRMGRLFDLVHRFVKVMCLLAVVSLVFWYLGVIAKVIEPNGYALISWGNFNRIHGFYGIHYAFQLDTTFFPEEYIYRNSGIFAEAPMFNLWLDIALAIEVFLTAKPSKWRVILLCVTILTTMSVTGIIFIVLCAVLWTILHYRHMSHTNKGLMFLAALIGIPLLVWLVAHTLVLKGDTMSFEMRLSDYVGGVQLWMDYPLFGAGFGNLSALQPYVYSPEGAVGFSNSIMAVLSTGGAWMALLYYLPHIAMVIPKVVGGRRNACFGICMLFLFCTTIFFARYIGVLVVMFGLALITGPKHEEP